MTGAALTIISCITVPVKVYYAPFEYINPSARIVLVGITPGPTQMVNANNEARRVLLAGKSNGDAIQAAKSVGAFSGEPLRSNLVNQLNHWGFNKWLGLGDSAELFSTARHLVQTTSLLRYPVFVKDDDYRGAPDMTRHPILRKYLLENFAAEVEQLKDAVFVGLGPLVQKVLDQLGQEGVINTDRVIGMKTLFRARGKAQRGLATDVGVRWRLLGHGLQGHTPGANPFRMFRLFVYFVYTPSHDAA